MYLQKGSLHCEIRQRENNFFQAATLCLCMCGSHFQKPIKLVIFLCRELLMSLRKSALNQIQASWRVPRPNKA